MELVVNRKYGGFGLSLEAQKMYLNLIGKEAFFYKQTKYAFDGGKNEYERVDNLNESAFIIYTVTEDLGKTTDDIGDTRESKHPGILWYDGDMERNDPMLIKVVETLKEKANGPHAELEIVVIPDGIEYEIEDYDGVETVHERHRSW